MTMEPVLVVRQTFWELEDEIPDVFVAGRHARSYSDFDIRYDGDQLFAALLEDRGKFDDDCCKATAETCSSAGSSADSSIDVSENWADMDSKAIAETCSDADSSIDLTDSIDLSENWADMDSDTESDDIETCCATSQVPVQPLMQHVMMPMRFIMVPVAQTNMVWGCQNVPQASVMSETDVRSRAAAPTRKLSMSPVEAQKTQESTTVVLRNLPAHLSRSDLVKILDDAGFSKRYDFLYLPTNFRNMTVFGYAIVNFSDIADAQAALEQFRGTDVDGQAMITEWSKSQQGYDDLVGRYRDSPVMHSSVPEKHKPIILANGCLQPFPPPTEPLQLPRKFTTKDRRFGRVLQ